MTARSLRGAVGAVGRLGLMGGSTALRSSRRTLVGLSCQTPLFLPRSFHSTTSPPPLGLFSSDRSSTSSNPPSPSDSTNRTQVIRVKDKHGSSTPAKVKSSLLSHSPSADFAGLSDDEFFDPRRPLRWLVAMDFSANAWRALKGAKQLLRRDRGDFLVIFSVPVLPFIDVGDDTTLFHGVDIIQEAVDAAVKGMEAVHDECRDLMGAYACEVSEPASDPRELLLMRLERQGEGRIDYAVCGQRGRSRLLNIVLGSVAIHLAHYSPTSVVIVK
jgi:nucleotide-binding universal stress UspA family protein